MNKREEIFRDNRIGLKKEVEALIKTHEPLATSRHYAFIDFEALGYSWSPVWFSIVREPIARVGYDSTKSR